MIEQNDSERNRQNDYENLRNAFFRFVEGTLIHGDFSITLEVVAEDVIGIGMGEQGYYMSKDELRKILGVLAKTPSEMDTKNAVEYGKIDIRIFNANCASIAGEIFLTTETGRHTAKSGLMQMASARKENGKWLFYMLNAVPLTLTEEGIEAYPLAFADNTLASLKAEMQTETFDLMNESFSGGILCTYIAENYPLCFANDSFIEMLGYERAEFEEKFRDNTAKLSSADDKEHMRVVSLMGEDGNTDFGSCARWVKKDGSIIWVEFRTRKTEDGYGNDMFLSVVMDVSEMVNLQIKTKEQNQTILDSIEYASKIQKNLLPKESAFEEAFSDHSVIWSPRDIVGGDIYWIKNFDGGTILCVCDCTGHGTPGALLTMLIVSAFEALVNEANYKDPAEIIWLLEQRLVSVFNINSNARIKGKTAEVQEGCDLAVLYIEKDGSVTVSAGHTHVFVCDGKEVKHFKGQNLYIGEGQVTSKEDVRIVTVPANPHNKFYIASDGLYDQLGGEPRRPFGYKAFMQIILENHNEKQAAISEKIYEAFENHRGKEARRDDMELITFKP